VTVVRRLAADEADLLRELRLRGMRDAPLAFGSTYAREVARPPAEWERWAAAGDTGAVFVAEPRAGLAIGMLAADEPALAHLYGVWVDPAARGAGVGRALVDAVVAWAGERGARRLATAVTEGNAPADRLYAAAGFAATGVRQPLGRSGATAVVLERALP
jgi:GNAT superfamily N-acetyltransferase